MVTDHRLSCIQSFFPFIPASPSRSQIVVLDAVCISSASWLHTFTWEQLGAVQFILRCAGGFPEKPIEACGIWL